MSSKVKKILNIRLLLIEETVAVTMIDAGNPINNMFKVLLKNKSIMMKDRSKKYIQITMFFLTKLPFSLNLVIVIINADSTVMTSNESNTISTKSNILVLNTKPLWLRTNSI